MLSYVYIKLCTGEDIISYKIQEHSDRITLSKPILIKQSITLSGGVKASAHPYCGLAKDHVVDMMKASCIFISDLRPEAEDYYRELAVQHYDVLDKQAEEVVAKKDSKATGTKVNLEDSVVTNDDKVIGIKSKDKPKLH